MENIKYEDLAAEEAKPVLDVEIKKEVMPVIQINFEELKAALNSTLGEYKGIIVTQQNLPTCKAKQKELAGVRNKLDTYRKDKKKKLSAPITNFESQIKELVALVEEAEQPIKAGITVFDDKKKAKKKATAEKIIKEVIAEQELNEKYAAMLDVSKQYCNLSAKEKDVKTDVEQRAFALKVEQDREEELINIVRDTLNIENKRLNKKLDFSDFQRLIDKGMSARDVIVEIKSRANVIYDAEYPQPKVGESKPIHQEQNKPVQPIARPSADENVSKVYLANYKIGGTQNTLKVVSEFLKTNDIAYKVTDTYEI